MNLEPLTAFVPSTYNPRLADAERLELVTLSLRKLGWLVPIYAARAEQPGAPGELLSGHQRHQQAPLAGFKMVPVEWLPPLPLARRKGLNIAFNRGTCDMDSTTSTRELRRQIFERDLAPLLAAVPDVDLSDPRRAYPCLSAERRAIGPLLRANAGRWRHHAKCAARTLAEHGVRMPVILNPHGRVVNGIGRLEHAAEEGAGEVVVVELDEARAALAETMMNLLSMDFDIHTRYADLLRHNSFRRAKGLRSDLGRVFTYFAFGGRASKEIDLKARPDQRRAWIAQHGQRVLDFGAGHHTEVQTLREVGVDADGFEPWRLREGTEDIDFERSVQGARAFLDLVASGKRWNSIFLATVLNSVPFPEDRRHIVRICTALCHTTTVLYSGCSSASHPRWLDVSRQYANETNASTSKFVLEYEPGVTIGDIAALPKVQKYHTRAEAQALFAMFFSEVKVSEDANLVMTRCARPKMVDPHKLEASLRFEFDLPYPEDPATGEPRRMGLADEAVAAFAARRRALGG